MGTFIPYQVDYTSKNMSKTFGFSKKRVSFKFGVANPETVQNGLNGAACRGSEHEIIFIWSLNSGKRQILADGKDVHFSESGQNGWTSDQVFQHKFGLKVPGINGTMKCHFITAPASKDVPGSRPFDLRLNGISYFAFSKIYELGTSRMLVRNLQRSRGGGGGGGYSGSRGSSRNDGYVTSAEERAIEAAKLASLREYENQVASQPHRESSQRQSQTASIGVKEEASLISFDDPAPPPPVPPRGQANFVSSMTMDPALHQQQPPPPNQFGGYSNYSLPSQGLPPAGPPSVQQPPPQPPQQQQQWNQPQTFPGSNAITPYYQSQPPAAPQQAPPPFGAPPPAFGAPPPYNNAPAGYGGNPLTSPSNQSFASYGSAPSFAQPPRQHGQPLSQPPRPPQQQQYGQPPSAQYGFASPPPPQGYAQY